MFNKSRLLGAAPLTQDAFARVDAVASGLEDGRSVWRVRHRATGLQLIQKVIHRDGSPQLRQMILTEVRVMHECNSPEIVQFYGAFLSPDAREVNLIMECMDGGCLDSVRHRVGRVPEPVLATVAARVCRGLVYLRDSAHVLHRDIKPSNILLNTLGDVKLCDFGVSRELMTAKAMTFVGTMRYMSPERIEATQYAVASDVWSLGITLVECATGRYPYPVLTPPPPLVPLRDPNVPAARAPVEKLAIFDFHGFVVSGPAPTLPSGAGFTPAFGTFLGGCLNKRAELRRTLEALLAHPFAAAADLRPAFMAAYVRSTLPAADLAAIDAAADALAQDRGEADEDDLDTVAVAPAVAAAIPKKLVCVCVGC